MLNFNTAPYFDDFDEGNKFYRILYRPSYAVQGRELTQAQSITQEQIKKFGDHIFEHGAMVIPGQITLDKNVSYQKMVETYGGSEVNPANFLGFTVIGDSSGVEGDVVNVAAKNETDPLTFFIKFKDSGTNNESIGFWDGETITRKDNTQIKATVEGLLNEVTPAYESTGKASLTSIDKGVYYVDGMFVNNDSQSIIVSKYGQRPTCRVGLRIYESVVTPEEDISLTDNAQGSPNYAAPGAHRYKIDLKLEFVDVDDDVSDDFIILQVLRQGTLVKEIRVTEYSELEKTFARRTFDESGDYTVNPFSIIMKEHLRDETDDSYKEGTFFAPDGDETKLIAEMGTGRGYVQGYEISKISKSNVELNKSRDYDTAINNITNFSLGNYIKIYDSHNVPRIDEFGEIQLWSEIAGTPGTPGSGTYVGDARVRAIRRFGDISYLYLFDIQMLTDAGIPYSFEDTVRWIYDTNGLASNNFTAKCVVEDEKVFLYKSSNNVLIFNLPNDTIKTLSIGGAGIHTSYASSRAYFDAGVVGNTATLVAQDEEVFQMNTESWYVADQASGVQYDNSSLDFAFSGATTGKQVDISPVSGTVNILAPVNKSIATQKTKYLQEDISASIAIPNKTPNGRDFLGKADCLKIKNIYMSSSLSAAAFDTDTDVTDRYQLDTGCRDNYYDVSSIILKSGKSAPVGQLLVIFDYFTHTNGDYFSVDSYVDIEFDEIPVYTSSESGGVFVLADAYDFRPRMSDNGTGFSGTGASIGELPQVFTDITADYEYYLNRYDYLYLDYTGTFMISQGVPAIYPRPPEKPEMGMVLYEIYIPAYTFKPKDTEPAYKDNKRYTMRDIGKLDTRIGNLEYYTALSLLERETASMEILDNNGLNRFKNGFIVDPFDSHRVGDATHSDYNCSVDPNRKIMRAKFNDENIGLMYDGPNSSHVQRTGGIITLPYTETAINKQTEASKYENINPYAFRNIFGKLTFNPDSDVWHDKKVLPTLVVDHSPNYEALKYIADNTSDLNGVEWGRWEDVGGRKNVKTTKKKSSKSSTESRQDTGISHDEGWLKTTTTTTVKSTTTWDQDQEREGIAQTNTDETVVSKSLGDRITEVNYIPYMRTIPVVIKTDQMKKKTKVYPFFDEISMSSHCDPPSQYEYCIPASKMESTAFSGDFFTANYGEEVIKGNISNATAIVMYQTENYILVLNIKGTFQVGETVTGVESGASITLDTLTINGWGDPIVTGEMGEVVLVWFIPNDDVLKFMTGEREFVLNDQITNADPVHTLAKGMFKSHGMGTKQEDTVLSTKTIKFTKEPVKQNRTVQMKETSSTSSESTGEWHDPIAQSFLVNETGGCFLTKVRVWFQNKDTEEAVVCEIRNMVNGYPDQIALTDTVVQPKNVLISERAPGEPTDFYFPEPIYLKEGESYCFVLKPAVASASYNVWVAETGRLDITSGNIITGKMSLGSFFKSQNASTWTANQNEDIMFELSKAKFDIASDGACHLVNDIIRPELLNVNPFETVKNSDKIRIYQNDHGMTETSVYSIKGLVPGDPYNGFLGSQINGEHMVIDTEVDSFVIQILGVFATESGLTGGTTVKTSRNYQLDLAHPLVNELIIDETVIDWTLATTSGQSVSGTQTPFVPQAAIPVINNEDVFMSKPMLIASPFNEDQYLSGVKSLTMVGTMHSDNENVSPVVDAANYDSTTEDGEDIYFKQSSSTFIAVSNRIDSPTTETWNIGADQIFDVESGYDELVVTQADHEMGTGSFVFIANFNDTLPGVTLFNPNGLHEIRVINKDSYIIDMEEVTTGAYTGSGDDQSTNYECQLAFSESNFIYVPETRSFNCSTSSRYMTKMVTLKDPAENFKMFFGGVREQDADIDVYFKTRSPYEVTEWNQIDWIRLDTPDENVAISESNTDFKDYTFTVELDAVDTPLKESFNAIAVKLVMKSTNSTQVPIFQDFRLICTT